MTLNAAQKPSDAQEAIPLEGGSARLAAPDVFPGHYTADDKRNVVSVIQWLNEHGKTQAWLCRLARVNAGTANQVLGGKYPSSPAKFLAQMLEATTLHSERGGKRGVPFVETSVAKLIRAACHRARLYRNFSVFAGYVGTGKTEALKQLAATTAQTYLVEADPDMSPGALLDALVEITHAEVQTRNRHSRGSTAEKFRALVRALDNTGALIIVDEAETMQPRALHYLRRIRDKAGVGIVLSGTEYLAGLIKPEHGQFDQIRSRVGFWPQTVTGITREDADAVAQGAFDELELSAPVLDALWAYSGGSIRVLAEDLIPALRDYGTAKGRTLDAALVKQIASSVLGLKARKEVA